MKFIYITLVLCLGYINVFSQQGAFKFENTTHDFGSIKEEDGSVTHEFKFTNTGSAPLIIGNVQASCGCTTPAWSRDPVLPGKTGFIRAQYDVRNRPGVFNKSLTITANTDPVNTVLTIKGIVVPKIRTIADDYPDTVGNIRLYSRFLDMGDITTKEPVTKEFKIYNQHSAPLSFSNPTSLPKHLKVTIDPIVVQSKGVGTIKVIYDAKLKNDFGFVNDNIVIPSTDPKHPKKDLTIFARVKDYFPPLTDDEMANAPKILLTRASHDFGKPVGNAKVETEFEITNTGKQDLILKKVKSDCACVTAKPERYIIKPGAKTKIKVVLDPSQPAVTDTKTITIYCNDPSNPMPTLGVKSELQKK